MVVVCVVVVFVDVVAVSTESGVQVVFVRLACSDKMEWVRKVISKYSIARGITT
jgi:hypothetical protein